MVNMVEGSKKDLFSLKAMFKSNLPAIDPKPKRKATMAGLVLITAKLLRSKKVRRGT
jgi:hypothetical protein